MKRKIIKQGHNTLTITLPSKWVQRFNVAAGKEIELIEKENGLFISLEKIDDSKKTEFNISGMDIPLIWKYLMAVYREGYKEVLIKFDPTERLENPYKFFSQHKLDSEHKKEMKKGTVIEALQGFISRFIGFEIIEQGRDYILVKEMGEITSKEFDNSQRRVFFLIQQMAEEILQALKTSNYSLLSHMHDVDINLDKFHDYCIRILNKTESKSSNKSALHFSILYLLELIGDEYKNISHHLYHEKHQIKFENVQLIASLVKEQFDTYYSLFYKFDKEKLSKISQIDSEIYFNISGIYKKSEEEEKEILHHLRMISRYINALLELRVEMEF